MFKIPRLILSSFILLVFSFATNAHPWGGLVVDKSQTIYFVYTCPMVGDNHYACVWRLQKEGQLEQIISSSQEPSDFILGRTAKRSIVAAERTGQAPAYNNRILRIDTQPHQLLYPTNLYKSALHLQTYSFTDEQHLYFARAGELFLLTPDNKMQAIELGMQLKYIDLVRLNHQGELFLVADNKLIKVTADTPKIIAKELKQQDPAHLPFQGANILFDMCIDDNDSVYLAYFGNREILRIDPQGTVTSVLKAEFPWSPSGIDCLDGDVYVLESTIGSKSWWKFWDTNTANLIPRIRKLSKQGQVSTLYQYETQ